MKKVPLKRKRPIGRPPKYRAPKQKIEKELDDLWSKVITQKGVCELKGIDGRECKLRLTGAHIISRNYKITRWDYENGICLCWGHHYYYTHHAEEWKMRVDQIRSEGYYQRIWERAWNNGQKAVLDLEAIKQNLIKAIRTAYIDSFMQHLTNSKEWKDIMEAKKCL